MARYRNDMDDERDYYNRNENLRRENFGTYDEPYRGGGRHQFETGRGSDFSRGRFGERAEYNNDEPRYADYGRGERFRDDMRRGSNYENRGDISSANWRDRDYQHPGQYSGQQYGHQYNQERSRLRCRDIMTRDLAVATRDTTLPEVALMMK